MATITTRAAVAHGPHQDWELTELQLDDPKEHEVRVKLAASGLCHSDHHITEGDAPVRFPMVGGHEGAGIVESVGPNVTRVGVGDRVVLSYIPACGACRPCSTGHQNMCVKGMNAGTGMFLDGTFRFHRGDEDFGGFCSLGTFSEYAVVSEWAVVPLPGHIPFPIASLVGCGVPTGWGSAVYAAGVRAGDTVVIFGAGGVGSNAVQGARFAGAKEVIVVDPVDFKRENATVFGATDTFATAPEAHEFVVSTTWGQLADHVILTPNAVTEEMVNAAVMMTGKGGKVTITAVGHLTERAVHVHAGMLIGYQRQIRGSLFGDCNPLYDIPRLLRLYDSGQLKLDELVTRTYKLDEINEAYADLVAGKNIRGVILHDE
jgi:alcohol dehydrogenase (nicotinoprotein)